MKNCQHSTKIQHNNKVIYFFYSFENVYKKRRIMSHRVYKVFRPFAVTLETFYTFLKVSTT